jgi:hypothetical protein
MKYFFFVSDETMPENMNLRDRLCFKSILRGFNETVILPDECYWIYTEQSFNRTTQYQDIAKPDSSYNKDSFWDAT